MNYDIVFADLDGTILRDDKTIPSNNIKAIKQMIDSGIDFVLASGRSHMSLKNINYELGINNYQGCGIAFNGSTIFEREPFKIIYEKTLSDEAAHNILKFLYNYKVETFVYSDNKLWVKNITQQVISYSKHSRIVPYRTKFFTSICKNSVNKIILMGDNNVLTKIQQKFNKTDLSKKIECCFSSNNLLEFNIKSDNKGTAVNYIMNLPQFKSKRSIAIGDSFNDIPMLEACDFSVVPSNCDDNVKAKASAVAEFTNNDGILDEVLEKYIL